MLARVVLYVIGELQTRSNTGDPEIDALHNEHFYSWCGDDLDDDGLHRCDFTGRHRLLKMVQMAFLAMLVDGDHGFVMVREGIGELQLQQVEGDRIGSPLEMQITEDYISGVTIDPGTGRTISYRIFKRTRTAQNLDPQEVSPDSFIHLWDPFRSDQYRGVTSLRSILEDAKDIKEWIGSEKFTGKIQSLYAAMVTSKEAAGFLPGPGHSVHQTAP
jgi:capsid protein